MRDFFFATWMQSPKAFAFCMYFMIESGKHTGNIKSEANTTSFSQSHYSL